MLVLTGRTRRDIWERSRVLAASSNGHRVPRNKESEFKVKALEKEEKESQRNILCALTSLKCLSSYVAGTRWDINNDFFWGEDDVLSFNDKKFIALLI